MTDQSFHDVGLIVSFLLLESRKAAIIWTPPRLSKISCDVLFLVFTHWLSRATQWTWLKFHLKPCCCYTLKGFHRLLGHCRLKRWNLIMAQCSALLLLIKILLCFGVLTAKCVTAPWSMYELSMTKGRVDICDLLPLWPLFLHLPHTGLGPSILILKWHEKFLNGGEE